MTKTLSWTITWETMNGTKYTSRYKAPTMSEAIDALVADRTVGNILEVHQAGQRWL